MSIRRFTSSDCIVAAVFSIQVGPLPCQVHVVVVFSERARRSGNSLSKHPFQIAGLREGLNNMTWCLCKKRRKS